MNIDELIEEIYWLNLQNLNGREDFEEAFMKGIEVAVTTLKEEKEQKPLSTKLFELANELAKKGYGDKAVRLHTFSNQLNTKI